MAESRGRGPFNRPSEAEPRGHETARTAGTTRDVEADEREFTFWQDRSRVFLQPIAAPSILGLFGLATALLMVGAWMAGWYGTRATPLILYPFVMTAGGLAQFLAGMWSYRARDGLATAVHGIWGAFWLGFGLFFMMFGAGALPAVLAPAIGMGSPGFAFWFIALCVITGICALAALAENMGMALTLTILTLGSGFAAAGFFAGSVWPLRVAGWMFVISAVVAMYTAGAMLLESTFGRTVLPTGRYRAAANIPGRRMTRPLEYRYGQPGVKIGQ
jgi:succinate-acetate transporter protein